MRLISMSLLSISLLIASNAAAVGDAGSTNLGSTPSASLTENRPGLNTAAEAIRVETAIDGRAIDPNKDKHKSAVNSCKEEVKKADLACAASQNPNAQQATAAQNQYANQNTAPAEGTTPDSGSSSQAGRCGMAGALNELVKGLMGNYANECSKARSQCPTACNETAKAAEQSCASIPGKGTDPQYAAKLAACQANAADVKSYAKSVGESCSKYAANQQEAMNVGSLMNALGAAMTECQEDVVPPEVAEEVVPETPPHQCTLSVDPAACTRSDDSGIHDMAKKMQATAPGTTLADTPGSVDGTATKKAPAANAALPYAPGGGGVGTGAGRAGDGTKADATGAKPMNTNVYAGDQSGGGGRQNGGFGYPEANDEGRRALAAAQQRKTGIASQFTGGYGRSNWQKVKERYVDKSPTLGPNTVANLPQKSQ